MTDNVHWADVLGPNGSLRSYSMGREKGGNGASNYFLNFLWLVPLIGWLERPRRLAVSVSQSIVARSKRGGISER